MLQQLHIAGFNARWFEGPVPNRKWFELDHEIAPKNSAPPKKKAAAHVCTIKTLFFVVKAVAIYFPKYKQKLNKHTKN